MKAIAIGGLSTLAVLAVLSLAVRGAVAEEASGPDPLQLARGAKAWVVQCNRCHNLRKPKELHDLEWVVVVTHMRRVGNLPGELSRDILAFLKASN
jgi:hypothetical protein